MTKEMMDRIDEMQDVRKIHKKNHLRSFFNNRSSYMDLEEFLQKTDALNEKKTLNEMITSALKAYRNLIESNIDKVEGFREDEDTLYLFIGSKKMNEYTNQDKLFDDIMKLIEESKNNHPYLNNQPSLAGVMLIITGTSLLVDLDPDMQVGMMLALDAMKTGIEKSTKHGIKKE